MEAGVARSVAAGEGTLDGVATAGCIEDYSWDEARFEFAEAWYGLVSSGGFNISLTADFMHAAASSHGRTSSLRVLVARNGRTLLGVLPYFSEPVRMLGIPMTMLALGGSVVSYHHEIPAHGCQFELLRALLIDPKRRWDVFSAPGLPANGPTAKALGKIVEESGAVPIHDRGDASPYLPINQTWDQYLASKSGNFRYNLRRKERDLRQCGNLEERWFCSVEEIDEFLQSMLQIESKSWKTNARIAVTSKPDEIEYYRRLLPFLAKRNLMFSSVLYIDRQPTAYQLSYFFGGRVGNLKTSFDEALQSASPGAVIIQRLIQRAFEAGATEFDFLGDAQHHKLLWTDCVREHGHYLVFAPRFRSRTIGVIKQFLQKRREAQHHEPARRGKAVGV